MFSFFLKFIFSPINAAKSYLKNINNIWVFGSWSGRYYNDNAKYLYEYILDEKIELRPVWITDRKNVLKKLRDENKECYMFYSFKGIFLCLIAKVLIVTDSWGDLPVWAYIFPWNKKIVQLWHGTLLRKVNLKVGSKLRNAWRKLFIMYLRREYDLVISGTDKNKGIFLDLFNTKNIVVTGQPRIDGLFLYKGLLRNKYLDKKIIMYLPTWRDNSFKLFNNKSKFNIKAIDRFLEKNKMFLIIKIHPYDLHKYNSLPKAKNIEFTTNMDDVYMYLSDVDILLTDYSSVYFDFLLLNRPIIFVPFDRKEYEMQHGFYYNYEDVTPGVKAQDWHEITDQIKMLIDGKDKFELERIKINKIFNKFYDDKNSQRVYKEILKLLKS